MAGNCSKTTATSETRTPRTAEELRAAILQTSEEIKEILDAAEEAGRELTDAEQQRLDELVLRTEGLNARLERAKRRTDTVPATASTFSTDHSDISRLFGGGGGSYTPSGKVSRGARWGAAVVRACSEGDGGRRWKGITPSGSVLVSVPEPTPVAMGRPVAQLRSLIPTQGTEGVVAFLRQIQRTNAAAPVAPGALKPTSQYAFERIQDRARTIAHLSTPLHRADLADMELLSELVSDEMHHGLEMALEAQILNGSGVGEELFGLASTAGVQTVARIGSVDDLGLLRTLRRAVTRLEDLGLTGTGWVMSPSAWESVETAVIDDGSFMLTNAGQSVPVDRAAKRLYGIPVVSTPSCPPGVAWLADFEGSTRLWVREEARIDWSEQLYDPNLLGAGQGATLFETNQCRFRCEGRFYFGVTRPQGVVRIALA
ncbi:phage major capsid protein [Actinoplanes sp. CA-051413]|uniref:phage major capsid protein n=1 Tax=Actinoplanes sp. CA-051413 TaxID=3239899 RepID=UPI003D972581